MWRNYWTVAVRALAKSKVYSFINIAGLAIGMAACLLIFLFVRYEQSYDRWIPNVDRSFQFQTYVPSPDSGDPFFLQMASYVTAERLEKDFPQIEQTVYALGGSPVLTKNGQVSTVENYLAVNDDFLSVVNLPVLKGAANGLSRNDTAMLTQSEAIRRFGSDDIIGQTLSLIQRGKQKDYLITAILKDIPKNSSLKINAIVRRDFPSFFADTSDFLTCWGCQSGWVFVRLKDGADPEAINAGLPAWEKRNIPDETVGSARVNPGDEQEWRLVNLADVHLGKAQDGSMTPGNDRQTLVTFSVIALLILGMAMVNFTNLATARASQRAREVALRKVLGANRKQLVAQFLGESMLIAAIAMLLALGLVELLVRPFAAFLDADLQLNYLGAGGILLPVVGLLFTVGLLGGLYPAFFLSRFQPAQVLKANRSASETPGSGRLRTALVVAQFAVSIGLIICTAVIYGQSVFARSVDPGYKRDGIVQLPNLGRAQLFMRQDEFVQRMRRVPGVTAVGLTDIGVNTQNNNNTSALVDGNPKPLNLGNYRVSVGFKDAAGLTMVAGRWFDDRPADEVVLSIPPNQDRERQIAARGINVVLNEGGVRLLGYGSPQEAIGKVFRTLYFSEEIGTIPMTVVGVVKDSRFRSIREPIDQLMFTNVRSGATTMVVRYNGDPVAVRAGLESAWKSLTSDVPFEADFSEDIIAELYESEEARAKIFAGFALLAVIIGCLGLFGLASFTAERRTKEIGIRKVLGARTQDIVRLLVWQFSRPVIIANIIAWPVAWWLMRDWLNGFDERITLGPGPFILAAVLALIIAIGTVAGHAFRIARSNPILALRYE